MGFALLAGKLEQLEIYLVLVPTVLTSDAERLKKDLAFLKGKVKKVQIDIVDGQFADNKTVAIEETVGLINTIDDDYLEIDFHLMTVEPVIYLEKDLPGATDFVIGQVEHMGSQLEFCRQARERGLRPGLAIDLDTPIARLDKMALDWSDQVLILGVRAGFSGQKFVASTLEKIKKLIQWRKREHWDFQIGVDGGLNEKTILQCRRAGGEIFYVGGAIWKAESPEKEIEKLKQIAA